MKCAVYGTGSGQYAKIILYFIKISDFSSGVLWYTVFIYERKGKEHEGNSKF